MMKNYYKFIFILFFIFISPWFISVFGNFQSIKAEESFTILYLNQYDIDEINTLRGELWAKNVPQIYSKIIVNKPIVYFQEFSKRYFQSFDPHYLFFVGSKQVLLNTQKQGLLYISFLPLIISFIVQSAKYNKNKSWLYALLIFALISGFIETEYEIITRVPLLLTYTLISAFSFMNIINNKKYSIAFILMMLIIFEFMRFSHYFYFIYPYDQLIYELK